MSYLKGLFSVIEWLACVIGMFVLAYTVIILIGGDYTVKHIDDGKDDIIIRIHR